MPKVNALAKTRIHMYIKASGKDNEIEMEVEPADVVC